MQLFKMQFPGFGLNKKAESMIQLKAIIPIKLFLLLHGSGIQLNLLLYSIKTPVNYRGFYAIK